MELEMGVKITRRRDDVSSSVDFHFSKDPFGPLSLTRETDSMFVLIVHLKGFKKEYIRIEINREGNRITITGRKPVQEMVLIRWMAWKKEVELRAFRKVFRIPNTVDLDKIKGKFNEEDGILTIKMPKKVKGISGYRIEDERDDLESPSEIANREDVDEQKKEAEENIHREVTEETTPCKERETHGLEEKRKIGEQISEGVIHGQEETKQREEIKGQVTEEQESDDHKGYKEGEKVLERETTADERSLRTDEQEVYEYEINGIHDEVHELIREDVRECEENKEKEFVGVEIKTKYDIPRKNKMHGFEEQELDKPNIFNIQEPMDKETCHQDGERTKEPIITTKDDRPKVFQGIDEQAKIQVVEKKISEDEDGTKVNDDCSEKVGKIKEQKLDKLKRHREEDNINDLAEEGANNRKEEKEAKFVEMEKTTENDSLRKVQEIEEQESSEHMRYKKESKIREFEEKNTYGGENDETNTMKSKTKFRDDTQKIGKETEEFRGKIYKGGLPQEKKTLDKGGEKEKEDEENEKNVKDDSLKSIKGFVEQESNESSNDSLRYLHENEKQKLDKHDVLMEPEKVAESKEVQGLVAAPKADATKQELHKSERLNGKEGKIYASVEDEASDHEKDKELKSMKIKEIKKDDIFHNKQDIEEQKLKHSKRYGKDSKIDDSLDRTTYNQEKEKYQEEKNGETNKKSWNDNLKLSGGKEKVRTKMDEDGKTPKKETTKNTEKIVETVLTNLDDNIKSTKLRISRQIETKELDKQRRETNQEKIQELVDEKTSKMVNKIADESLRKLQKKKSNDHEVGKYENIQKKKHVEHDDMQKVQKNEELGSRAIMEFKEKHMINEMACEKINSQQKEKKEKHEGERKIKMEDDGSIMVQEMEEQETYKLKRLWGQEKIQQLDRGNASNHNGEENKGNINEVIDYDDKNIREIHETQEKESYNIQTREKEYKINNLEGQKTSDEQNEKIVQSKTTHENDKIRKVEESIEQEFKGLERFGKQNQIQNLSKVNLRDHRREEEGERGGEGEGEEEVIELNAKIRDDKVIENENIIEDKHDGYETIHKQGEIQEQDAGKEKKEEEREKKKKLEEKTVKQESYKLESHKEKTEIKDFLADEVSDTKDEDMEEKDVLHSAENVKDGSSHKVSDVKDHKPVGLNRRSGQGTQKKSLIEEQSAQQKQEMEKYKTAARNETSIKKKKEERLETQQDKIEDLVQKEICFHEKEREEELMRAKRRVEDEKSNQIDDIEKNKAPKPKGCREQYETPYLKEKRINNEDKKKMNEKIAMNCSLKNVQEVLKQGLGLPKKNGKETTNQEAMEDVGQGNLQDIADEEINDHREEKNVEKNLKNGKMEIGEVEEKDKKQKLADEETFDHKIGGGLVLREIVGTNMRTKDENLKTIQKIEAQKSNHLGRYEKKHDMVEKLKENVLTNGEDYMEKESAKVVSKDESIKVGKFEEKSSDEIIQQLVEEKTSDCEPKYQEEDNERIAKTTEADDSKALEVVEQEHYEQEKYSNLNNFRVSIEDEMKKSEAAEEEEEEKIVGRMTKGEDHISKTIVASDDRELHEMERCKQEAIAEGPIENTVSGYQEEKIVETKTQNKDKEIIEQKFNESEKKKKQKDIQTLIEEEINDMKNEEDRQINEVHTRIEDVVSRQIHKTEKEEELDQLKIYKEKRKARDLVEKKISGQEEEEEEIVETQIQYIKEQELYGSAKQDEHNKINEPIEKVTNRNKHEKARHERGKELDEIEKNSEDNGSSKVNQCKEQGLANPERCHQVSEIKKLRKLEIKEPKEGEKRIEKDTKNEHTTSKEDSSEMIRDTNDLECDKRDRYGIKDTIFEEVREKIREIGEKKKQRVSYMKTKIDEEQASNGLEKKVSNVLGKYKKQENNQVMLKAKTSDQKKKEKEEVKFVDIKRKTEGGSLRMIPEIDGQKSDARICIEQDKEQQPVQDVLIDSKREGKEAGLTGAKAKLDDDILKRGKEIKKQELVETEIHEKQEKIWELVEKKTSCQEVEKEEITKSEIKDKNDNLRNVQESAERMLDDEDIHTNQDRKKELVEDIIYGHKEEEMITKLERKCEDYNPKKWKQTERRQTSLIDGYIKQSDVKEEMEEKINDHGEVHKSENIMEVITEVDDDRSRKDQMGEKRKSKELKLRREQTSIREILEREETKISDHEEKQIKEKKTIARNEQGFGEYKTWDTNSFKEEEMNKDLVEKTSEIKEDKEGNINFVDDNIRQIQESDIQERYTGHVENSKLMELDANDHEKIKKTDMKKSTKKDRPKKQENLEEIMQEKINGLGGGEEDKKEKIIESKTKTSHDSTRKVRRNETHESNEPKRPKEQSVIHTLAEVEKCDEKGEHFQERETKSWDDVSRKVYDFGGQEMNEPRRFKEKEKDENSIEHDGEFIENKEQMKCHKIQEIDDIKTKEEDYEEELEIEFEEEEEWEAEIISESDSRNIRRRTKPDFGLVAGSTLFVSLIVTFFQIIRSKRKRKSLKF